MGRMKTSEKTPLSEKRGDSYTNKLLKKTKTDDIQHLSSKKLDQTVNGLSLSLEIEDDSQLRSYIPAGIWLTGASLLWNQGFAGTNIRVGVIDSGIDPNHNDLSNVDKRVSYVGDEEYSCFHPHGTHVGGTIGANGIVKGVSPLVKMNDYRIFDDKGISQLGNLEKAIVQAVDDGCDVINLSLESLISRESLENAVKYAKDKGTLLVVAAGDEGSDTVEVYPASYSSVLSVAAIDFDLTSGKITFENTQFSNRNSEVDVCADGYKVLSTFKDNFYGIMSGTSVACPHVSGFAALMKQKANLVTKNTDHTVCSLYTLVKTSTVPIDVSSLVPYENVVDICTGAGLVTAFPEVPVRLSETPITSGFYLPGINKYFP